MAEIVISAVGPDRPGLVSEFTKHLYEGGLNIADSRMVNLRGQFALVLLAEGSDEAIEQVRAGLPRQVEATGLAVSFGGKPGAARAPAGLPFRLKTYSLDQRGIVHRVGELLRRHGANIEELDTRLESAPFDGAPIFTLELRMTLPQKTRMKDLRGELGGLCDELNCDFDLEPA